MNLLRALRHRPFALLWGGQTVSRLGDSLYRIALIWWVVQKTGSPAIMGTVLIFSFTPMLIFLLIGGLAADRFPRVRLMLFSDLLRGGLVILIALAAASNTLEVWHVLAASFIFGFLDAFFQPAYAVVVPDITPGELLNSANSLTSLSGQAATVLGPSLGAALIALGGTSTAFALDALSFFISAACLLPLLSLTAVAAAPTDQPRPGLWHDLRDGIGTVFASGWLWITIVLFGLVNITVSGPMSVALPFLIKNDLHLDVSAFGVITSVEGVGLVIGTILIGRTKRVRHRGLVAYGASIVGGLMMLIMGLPVGIVGIVAAVFVLGATLSIFSLIWTQSLQELVPREKLGRVVSVDSLGSFVLLPIGYGLTGWLTDRWSASTVFIISGALTVILLAIGLAQPAIHRLD